MDKLPLLDLTLDDKVSNNINVAITFGKVAAAFPLTISSSRYSNTGFLRHFSLQFPSCL